MIEIPLTQGKVALIDDEDYDLVSQYKWSLVSGRNTFYAEQKKRVKYRHMHRFIMNTPDDMVVDHLDGNGLNNQKYNMRNCTYTQNCQNRTHRNEERFGYQGVFRRSQNKFYVYIRYNSKLTHLGVYTTAEQAAEAYNKRATELYGENAKLNTIKEVNCESIN